MDISGSFVFSISDKNLDFKDIKDNLPIEPTKLIKRGQKIGKAKKIVAPYDIWSCEVDIVDSDNIFNDLLPLLKKLLPYSMYIAEAKIRYESVIINCFIRSDYAQLGLHLGNEIIKKLCEVGLSIDFHILSFGGVSD